MPQQTQSLQPLPNKVILKLIQAETNPYFLDALITTAEARLRQLNPPFKSHTPQS